MSRRDGYWETNPDKAAHAHALWDDGLSASHIGRLLGVTKGSICGLKNRRGWKQRGSPIRPPRPDVGVRQQQRRIRTVRVASVSLSPLLALLDDPILLTTTPRERPPKPKPVIEAPRPVQQSTHQCRWLDGDKPFKRCEAMAWPGYAYCEAHCRRAYVNWHGAALDEVSA
jgi:hypothetical protein